MLELYPLKFNPLFFEKIWGGENIKVEWFELSEKTEIPDLPWDQIYAIGDLDGKVPIVLYETAKPNLPGGHTESGETLEETLHREIFEEINCEVLEWRPLGYQIVSNKKYGTEYQFRVYAKFRKLGEFREDVGGNVIGYDLVELEKLNDFIKYGKVGERIIELVKNLQK